MGISLSYIQLEGARAAILHAHGVLDWSNYHDLVGLAWAARDAGAQHLLVDLSDADRVSTAGLVGLHAVALIALGVEPPDADSGWAAIRALAEADCPEQRLAVLNPRPRVRQTLSRAPFAD